MRRRLRRNGLSRHLRRVVDPVAGDYNPAWIFPDVFGADAKKIADTVSHEVGHNLDLEHDFDGDGPAFYAYYPGHAAWGPIMGTGFDKPIVQWSKGEFADSGNNEDDLAVIAASGAPLRADDHGRHPGRGHRSRGRHDQGRTGIIGTPADKDYFSITVRAPGRSASTPDRTPVSPNLDIQVRLLDAAGVQVASANPASARVDDNVASGMGAQISQSVSSGVFYVEVDGVGAHDPLTTGYSDYGSLGNYTLTVTGCGAPAVPTSVQTTKTSAMGSVAMSWQPPAYDGGYPVTGYALTRDGVTVATLGAAARSHTFTGLAPAASSRWASLPSTNRAPVTGPSATSSW